MPESSKATDSTAVAFRLKTAQQVFSAYGRPAAALVPHRRPTARRLFLNSWLIGLLLLAVGVTNTIPAILTAENPLAADDADRMAKGAGRLTATSPTVAQNAAVPAGLG